MARVAAVLSQPVVLPTHLLLADDALCGVQDCCSSFVVVCKSALRLNKYAGGYADMFMCA